MAGTKFWTSTVLLLNAAFISLSGAAGEPRRCYWCGPLAEQVHRSRRSAACGGSDPVTTCEPGHNYCAVVATSPPRVESRYCVKMYQDECYPLFCNSTKTWKMTCPCRGDLCNGPNTEREIEAFALLPKLVAKTHNARIKKRTAIASPHLIKHGKMRIIGSGDTVHNDSDPNVINASDKLIVNEKEPGSHFEDMQSHQLNSTVLENHDILETDARSVATNQDYVQSTIANNQLIEIEIYVSEPTELSDTMKEIQPCSPSTIIPDTTAVTMTETGKHEEISEVTTAETATNNENPLSTANVIVPQNEETMKITKFIQHVETTDVPNPPKKTTERMHNGEPSKPSQPEDQMQNDAPILNSVDSVQSITTTEPTTNKIDVNPSERVPTAETLEQNSTPTLVIEKNTQAMPTEATLTTKNQKNIAKVTTTPVSKRKNSAERITFSYALFLSFFVYL